MSADTHGCAVASCDRQIAGHLAMCPPHWRIVPRPLQFALVQAYRDRRRPGGVAEHLQRLEDARAAVEDREPRELFGPGEAIS